MADIRLDKFKFNNAFAERTLKGPAAQKLTEAKGREVQARASSMYGATAYGMKTRVGSKRVHTFVYTADRHAMSSNRVHNTLKKALG